MSNIHSCQECDWFHDYGTHGYCKNKNVNINELNRIELEGVGSENNCKFFSDEEWFGG